MKILFVCLGNICRSAAAEAVMKKLVQAQDMTSNFEIDSAGLINYHEGEPADPRMRAHAARRGYIVDSISRPIRTSDFFDFDLIIGMDDENRSDMMRILGSDPEGKVHLLMEYTDRPNHRIEDPWWTDRYGVVFDDIADGCSGLLKNLNFR